MKAAGLVLATALALAVQTFIGRLFGGNTGVDLVLVVVVFAALSFGPVTGLLTGTVAGLVQDAMATGIIGVGGLADGSRIGWFVHRRPPDGSSDGPPVRPTPSSKSRSRIRVPSRSSSSKRIRTPARLTPRSWVR